MYINYLCSDKDEKVESCGNNSIASDRLHFEPARGWHAFVVVWRASRPEQGTGDTAASTGGWELV